MKRFNWIDILIVVVIIGALAFAGMKLLGGNGESVGSDEKVKALSEPNLRMVVEIPEVSRETAENAIASFAWAARELDGNMVENTRVYNSNRLVDAQITSWEILDTEEEDTVCLRFTVEANAEVYRGTYTVGNQEIRIGKGYIAKTLTVELTGTVVSMTELK